MKAIYLALRDLWFVLSLWAVARVAPNLAAVMSEALTNTLKRREY